MLTERHTDPSGMLARGPLLSSLEDDDDEDCIQRPSCALAGRHGNHDARHHGNGPGEEEGFDDVDEDDISDDDDCYMLHKHFMLAASRPTTTDGTEEHEEEEEEEANRLLSFASRVNKDITKLFGHKKDSFSIYEDRWRRGKSGRELYYADLLRIAQGEDTEERAYTGKMDRKMGLGPLKELFEAGGNGVLKGSKVRSRGRGQSQVLPMKERQLPASFWKEPVVVRRPGLGGGGGEQQPDFSDLLESWRIVGLETQHATQPDSRNGR